MILQILTAIGVVWLVINFLVPNTGVLALNASGLYQQYKLEFWIVAGVLFYVYVLPRLQQQQRRR